MFKKLGGKAAIEGVVDEFYSRVFVDDEVKGFFEGIDKHGLKSHQVQFLLYSPSEFAAGGLLLKRIYSFCNCFNSCLDGMQLCGTSGASACTYLQLESSYAKQ